MGAFDSFNETLANMVLGVLGKQNDAALARLAALHAARSVKPDSDVDDRITLANYILTGAADLPEASENPYPFTSGDALVLGPEIFVGQNEDGDDVICWQGVNFVRQPQAEPLTGVVGPDPAFGPVDEEDEEIDREREPAPSAGTRWAGRRGGQSG
jgi:hypothetical protein